MKKLTKIKLLTMCSALALNATFAADQEAAVEKKDAAGQPQAANPSATRSGWTLGGLLNCFNPFAYSWFGGASPEEKETIHAALKGDEDAFGEAVVSHAMLQLSPEEQEAAMLEMQKAQIVNKLKDAVSGFADLPEAVRDKMIAAVLEPGSTEALVAASKAIMETMGLDGATVLDQLTALMKAEKESEHAAADSMPALIPSDDEEGDLSKAVRKMDLAEQEPKDITAARDRIAELEAKKTKNGNLSRTEKGQLGALKNKVRAYEKARK